MTPYMKGLKSDLNCLYDQKGTMIFFGMPMQRMTPVGYVDITSEWMENLDAQIAKLRSLLESGKNPKH